MIPVKEKDFIALSYTGRIKDSGIIFDLTDADLAKKEGIYDEHNHTPYGTKIICVGEGHVIHGLDKTLVGREPGTSFLVELKPEDAFGIRNTSLVKTIQTSILLEQNIRPFPGLQIQGPGMMGIIRAVSGGRTIVDFNHPLAGKIVLYEAKIEKIIEDTAEKVKALLFILLHLHQDTSTLTLEGTRALISSKETLPEELKTSFKIKTEALIPGIDVTFG